MVMCSPKLWIYLGEIRRYTIVAWIFTNENKYCTLGGLVVKEWYTLVIGHYKYIIKARNDIIILSIT